MCKLYGQKAYKYVPTYSVFDEQFVREKTCKDQQKLIKNGINAEENEFPHMVSITVH